MNTAKLLALSTLVSLAACVSDPVKSTKPGKPDTMAVTTGAAGTAVQPSGTASGAAGSGTMTTGEAGSTTGTAGSSVDPTGTAGSGNAPDAGDMSGAAGGTAGSGMTMTTGGAGTTGAAGTTGVAGTTGAAGTTAGAGAAGTAGAGAAGTGDAGVPLNADANGPVTITDPCDRRTWTFTPSIVCTTCAGMPDAQKLPANAIDGNATTRYTTGISQGSKGPEVAILSFSKPVSLTGLNLVSKGGDGPTSYVVESSLDGANFSYFTPGAMGAGSDNLVVTFPARTKLVALRITQTGVKATNWWSIHELTPVGCMPAP